MQTLLNGAIPYWGIQNGTEAYAEIFVKLKDQFTGAEHVVYRNTIAHPLILKDCPYILQDSIRLNIAANELPNTFQTGDPIDIEAVVLWTTDARRTALWSKNEPHNRLTMCGAFNELFALDNEITEETNIETASAHHRHLEFPSRKTIEWGLHATSAKERLHRSNPDGTWEYFKAHRTGRGFCDHHIV